MRPIAHPESAAQAETYLKQATLSQAQEAEIAAKLAKAASLDLPTFAERSLKVKAFCEWYEKRFEAIPALEKITDDKRAAFMTYWEKYLRNETARKNYEAYIDELLATESDDVLPEYRRDAVQHDRENEDGRATGDDDGGDDEDPDPVEDMPPDPPAPTPRYLQTAPPPEPPQPADEDDCADITVSENDPRAPILSAWNAKFKALPYDQQEAWVQSHRLSVIMGPGGTIVGDGCPSIVWLEPKSGVDDSGHPFTPYNARALILLAAQMPESGEELDASEHIEPTRYVVPGLIPYGLTYFFGDQGATKSLLLQKMMLAVSDVNGATFEGIEVEHGTVLFATLDPNALPEDIRPGVKIIRGNLGLEPGKQRLILNRPPLYLNDPRSVEQFLDLNGSGGRLPAKIIVVDSLFSAVTPGSGLAQETTISAVNAGVARLRLEADAVVITSHENKSGELYGSVFQKPATGAVHYVERPYVRRVRSNRVTVTTERMKFDSAMEGRTLEYELEPHSPFLTLVADSRAAAGTTGKPSAPIKRAALLELLPVTATPKRGSRERFAPGLSEKQWQRQRAEWANAGLIEQTPGESGTFRRIQVTGVR